MKRNVAALLVCTLAGYAIALAGQPKETNQNQGAPAMRLGNFSVSLAVKDIKASYEFYQKLGFRLVMGDPAKAGARNFVIVQNETATIGLFQGMFDKNIMTFNPGWDRTMKTLPEFDDVRDIQKALKAKGITPSVPADESGSGPGSLVLLDPDGNQIIVDQHVPSPKK